MIDLDKELTPIVRTRARINDDMWTALVSYHDDLVQIEPSQLVMFDQEELVLHFCDEHGCYYEIEMENLCTAYSFGFWILLINSKPWCTPQILTAFISEFQRAFQIVFGCNLSTNLVKLSDWKIGRMKQLAFEDRNHV